MTEMTMKELLGAGWSESASGMLVNPSDTGGIIDQTIADKTWFVIFGDDRQPLDGFYSRDAAIMAFVRAKMMEFE